MYPRRPRPTPRQPAAMSTGMMFTIMGRGSPISPNTEAQGASPRTSPLPHLKREEMREKTTLTSCKRLEQRERERAAQMSLRYNFTLAGRLSKSRNITQAAPLPTPPPVLYNCICTLRVSVTHTHSHSHTHKHTHPHPQMHSYTSKTYSDARPK